MTDPIPSSADEQQACVNSYGPESGPHSGPAEWRALLVSGGNPDKVLISIGPLCRAHADYEQRWRKAVGSIAKVRIEPWTDRRQ